LRFRQGCKGSCSPEITKGLHEGDKVVTFGSFFIDSNHKLKFSDPGETK
jgi:hypothetical protein